MMEAIEDIRATLTAFGRDLDFDNGTIQGIVEIDLSILSGESTVYGVEKQEFRFQCYLQDVIENDLEDGDTFITSDGIYEYTFQLNRPPVSDMLGWCTLHANYISKELI